MNLTPRQELLVVAVGWAVLVAIFAAGVAGIFNKF